MAFCMGKNRKIFSSATVKTAQMALFSLHQSQKSIIVFNK